VRFAAGGEPTSTGGLKQTNDHPSLVGVKPGIDAEIQAQRVSTSFTSKTIYQWSATCSAALASWLDQPGETACTIGAVEAAAAPLRPLSLGQTPHIRRARQRGVTIWATACRRPSPTVGWPRPPRGTPGSSPPGWDGPNTTRAESPPRSCQRAGSRLPS
jgi:hypothetical protein